MKTLEKLLQEYKIRYKETEEIDEDTYPFSPMFKAHHGFKPAIVWEGEWYSMMNINGEVYQNDIWATAKITEKPEKFVIERNTEHKHWGDFHEWWSSQLQLGEKDLLGEKDFDGSSNYFGIDKINKFSGKSLLDFEGFQYLTIDQWAELFLDEPKEDSEFEKAVKPAIRYLLKNYNLHTKIMIDYDTAELLSGEASVSLSNEVPD